MDTISRENNSMLPVAGVIVGVIALLIGGYAAINVSKVKTTLGQDEEKLLKIDDLSSQVSSSAAASDKASKDIQTLQRSTQDAVTQIASEIGTLNETIKHLQEAPPKRAAGRAGRGEPAVAGPGEYIVRSGDSGARIARAQGVSLADLKAVNPEVNWSKLHIGEKLKLPEKRGASTGSAPAAAAP